MKETKRALRRHQAYSHMWRRLKEDRNQHYNDLDCACYEPGVRMSMFKEQPKLCGGDCCRNPRFNGWGPKLTIQELRAIDRERE